MKPTNNTREGSLNKSQLEDDIYYADNAESLTSNPAYQAAIIRLKAKLFEQFGSTGFFQRRKREELWKMKRILDQFETELNTMIQDGNLAKDDMKREKKLRSI